MSKESMKNVNQSTLEESNKSSGSSIRLYGGTRKILNSLTMKFTLPLAILVLFIAPVLGFYFSHFMTTSIRKATDEKIAIRNEDIIRNLEASNNLVLEQCQASMRVLKREALALGEPSLGETVTVGDTTAPNLYLGKTPQANNFSVVDKMKELMGGTATLFVKRGNDFVRDTTNITKPDGTRGVGTQLDPNGKAIAQLRQDKPFYGFVDILGKPYITGYEPMHNAKGELIGVWYVGYLLSSLNAVGENIKDSRVLDEGFFALVDDKGKIAYQSQHASSDVVQKIIGSEKEPDGWHVTRTMYPAWGYTLVAAYSENDPVLASAITRVRISVIVGIAVTALLLLLVGYFLARNVSRPLGLAVEAANRLAVGDVSVEVKPPDNPERMDETEKLLMAMHNMMKYLRDMADVSDKIAEGDLSSSVMPRSPKDRFGNAFSRVIFYLKHMAHVSDEIAAGKLNVTVEPRSENDRFGNSFKNMLDNTLSLVQSREERNELQKSMMKLLGEVADVANGDLTVEAEVTADMTGAMADAFNFMIVELRQIIGNVKTATEQVTQAATELQAQSENLASDSETRAAQLVETSTELEDMAKSIQMVSTSANVSVDIAKQSLENAKQGSVAVENTTRGMNRIRGQVQETSKRIKHLGERSQEIGEIVKLIDDIADRTSILALNASIQAAMAGEAGRGFAVVAEEVERLAERSATATKQIEALVKVIQAETNSAVVAMEETTREVVAGSDLAAEAKHALHEIETVSERLAELVESMSHASQKQAHGSQVLAQTMSEVSHATQEVAAGNTHAARSMKSLVALAEELHGSVVTFKLPEQNRTHSNDDVVSQPDAVSHGAVMSQSSVTSHNSVASSEEATSHDDAKSYQGETSHLDAMSHDGVLSLEQDKTMSQQEISMLEHDAANAHDVKMSHLDDVLEMPDFPVQQPDTNDAHLDVTVAHENIAPSQQNTNAPAGEVLSVAGVVTNAQLN
ncbi:MAG: hypothetical protein NVSMB56_04900 [Pyrinomonadaceae bacterium]